MLQKFVGNNEKKRIFDKINDNNISGSMKFLEGNVSNGYIGMDESIIPFKQMQ